MLAETLKNNGFKIYSGGTDTHLMLVDLRPFNVKGNVAAESLSRANTVSYTHLRAHETQ